MNNKTPQDVYELIRRKEARSYWWSIGLILICMALGVTTIFYGIQADKNKEEAQEKAEDLKSAYKVTDSLFTVSHTLVEELRKDSISSENAKAGYESQIAMLTKELDEIKKILNTGSPDNKKDEVKIVINKIKEIEKVKPVVYLHLYGKKGYDVLQFAMDRLNSNGLPAKGIDLIKEPFASRITYFHPEDKSLAERVFKVVLQAFSEKGLPLNEKEMSPQFSRMRAPSKQVEVWINLEPKSDQGQQIKDQLILEQMAKDKVNKLQLYKQVQ